MWSFCLFVFVCSEVVHEDLKQAHRLAEMYREQCITLETELSQIREEGDVSREIFKVQCVAFTHLLTDDNSYSY